MKINANESAMEQLRALFRQHAGGFATANVNLRFSEKHHIGAAMWAWMVDRNFVSAALRQKGNEVHHGLKTGKRGHPLWRIVFRRTVRGSPELDVLFDGKRKGPTPLYARLSGAGLLQKNPGDHQMAVAIQKAAEIQEIEQAARMDFTLSATSLSTMSQSKSVALAPEQPHEMVVDLGNWAVEDEATTPAADGTILTHAMEIQRAIADHLPIDASVEWNVIDFAEPREAEPATAPKVRGHARGVQRLPGLAITSVAEALTAWGRQAEISNDTSDGAAAPVTAASKRPLSHTNAI